MRTLRNPGEATPLEIKVLKLAAEGLGNKEMATVLRKNVSSPAACLQRLYRAWGASNRAHAVTIGFRKGILR